MVIDTSALAAILFGEPELDQMLDAIEAVESKLLSTANMVECSIVIESRLGAEGIRDFDQFIARAPITLVPVDGEQAIVARNAFRRFGKGRHPAALNFGDCFAYALAKVEARPLLFKGGDFSKTDVESAL